MHLLHNVSACIISAMRLPFLDRDEETARLTRLLESREGSLAVL